MADRVPLRTELGTHILATGGFAGFVTWNVLGDKFGNRLAETFTVKRRDREEQLDLASQPFLLDAVGAKVGWVEAFDENAPKQKGQQPRKFWWADRNVPEPRPAGIKTRQAIQCVLLTAAGERFLWEQAGAACVKALISIYAQFRADPTPWYADEVPALRHVGALPDGTGQFATVVPQLRVEAHVPRPAAFDQPLPDDKPRQAGNGTSSTHTPSLDEVPAGWGDEERPFG
jgi:hypothetical protein